MRGKVSKLAMFMLVLSMTVSMFVVNASAADATTPIDDCGRIVEAYDLDDAEDYINDGDASTYPKTDTKGYIFAGWYTDETCGEDSYWGQEEPGDTVYALFVPSHVLDVKAQVSSNLLNEDSTDDGTASIRFVTTVDTLLYNQVGFTLSYVGSDGTTKNATSSSNKVYQKLYAVGSTSTMDTEYTPKGSFCNLSTYFKACTVTKVTAENYTTKFSVAPFWKTLDGSIVYGETVEKSINDYFEQSDVYVKEDGTDAINRGSYDKPFATLDYALQYVEDGGTVHVIGAVTEDASATWTAHNKSVTITNDGKNDGTDSITFAATTVNVQDSVKFTGLGVNFASGATIYAWGNTLEIDSDVTDREEYVIVYGGGTSAITSDTNVILRAGNYTAVYGGGNKAAVNGNTNVTLSGTINNGIDHKSHSMTYYVIGGGNSAAVNGNTNVTVSDSTVYFNYIYGGGKSGAVTGDCTVNYAGSAMSVYGGGKSATVTGDTHLIMTGGWVEQLFGGCEGSSMTGNTEVRVTGGEVKRRIYGGCYNEGKETIEGYIPPKFSMAWSTEYKVNGYSSVTIADNANLTFDYTKTYASIIKSKTDNTLSAFSRHQSVLSGEKAVLIFNDDLYSSNSSKIKFDCGILTCTSGAVTNFYNYLVKASVGGTVTAEGNCIRVVPDSGKVATVRLGSTTGTIIHYADGEGVCALPELSSATATQEIYVVFSDSTPSDVTVSNYEAKINGGYYTTVEEAFETAKVMDSATIELLKEDVEVESTLSIENSENITVKNADGVNATVHRADALTNGSIFDVDAGGTLTVDGIILDGRTPAEITAGTTDVALLTGSTASLINTAGEVHVNNVIAQYAVKTSGFGAVLYGEGVATTVVTVDSSEFNYNKSADQGGAICMYAHSGNLEVSNSIFTNNHSDNNGGAISAHAAKATITNCQFTENTSDKVGGAFYSGTSCQVTMKNTTNDATKAHFTSNTGNQGGALGNGSGKVSVTGYTFTSNTGVAEGGAVYNNNSTFEAISCDFTDNYGPWGGAILNTRNVNSKIVLRVDENCSIKAQFVSNETSGNGGAITMNHGSIDAEGYTFDGNIATSNGGAIQFNNQAITATFKNVSFINNKAAQGGAINNTSTQAAAQFTFEATDGTTKFYNNTSTNSGGAIYNAGKMDIVGYTFDTNKSTGSTGGAIQNQGSATDLAVVNTKFVLNEAKGQGGAISNAGSAKMRLMATSEDFGVTKATLAVFEGNVSNNTAIGFGGGAVYFGSGSFSVDGYAFNNNASKGDAGALCLRAASSVTNCTFDGNDADKTGGALFIYNNVTVTDSTFTNNTAVGTTKTVTNEDETTTTTITGGGGAIHNDPKGTLTIKNSSFSGNTTKQTGGAIFNANKLTVTESSFTSNTAKDRGGAIFNNGSKLTVTDTYFEANGGDQGGAIAHQDNNGAVITIEATGNNPDKAIFKANTTEWNGAAIRLAGGTTTIKGYTFVSHYAVNNGGAIYIDTAGKLNVEDTTFGGSTADLANTAKVNGGALYNGGSSTTTLTGTSAAAIFEGNSATGSGGALGCGSGTLNINGYTFKSNTATGSGGAIWANSTTANIEDSTFVSNSASAQGGAVYVNGGTKLNVTNSTFGGAGLGNTAGTDGGAIYNAGSSTSVVRGTDSTKAIFEGNKANGGSIGGGAYAVGTGTLDIDGYVFKNNYAKTRGGAIGFNTTSGTLKVSNSEFNANYTDGYGGAILSRAVSVDIDDVDFIGNYTVDGHGGAFYQMDGTGTVTIDSTTGSKFENNKAQGDGSLGGAIYIAKGSLVVNGYEFTGNEASDNEAVYLAEGVTGTID